MAVSLIDYFSDQVRKAVSIVAFALSLASAAHAEDETIPIPELCDGSMTGNDFDLAALNEKIGGRWNQLGRAQRYTAGEHINPFEIVYDETRDQLIIRGNGPTLRLRPFHSAKLADVPMTNNNLRQSRTMHIAADGSHTVRMTGADLELLYGCPFETAPSFYWTYTHNGQQSFGILVFLSETTGFGVNGHSNTGASRTTLMYR